MKKLVAGIVLLIVIISGLFFCHKKENAINQLKYPKVYILMYHSVLDDDTRASQYVVTPKMLREDFEFIKKSGVEVINSYDLLNYIEGKASLPDISVMITFDDGYYNNLCYAQNILKEFSYKGILSVVGEYSSLYSKSDAPINKNYSHITFENIKAMAEENVFEFANHSFDMHNLKVRKGILKKKTETAEEYTKLLKADTLKNEELILTYAGYRPKIYAYPFGATNTLCQEIIEGMGYKITLGCEEGVNIIQDKASLFNMKRYNRDGNLTTNEFFEKININ